MRRAIESEDRGRSGCRGRVLLAGALLLVAAGAPGRARAQVDRGRDVVEAVDEGTGRPWADGVPLETRRKAYAIFLAGNGLMKEALFAQGAEKYEAALALWDHPAFHYNLGVAQMNLDKVIEAYRSFERSLVHGPRPIGQDKHELARSYMKVLGNQLAELEVVCDEPGAAVALDGKPLFMGPGRERVLVRPGGHRVEATKARREPDIQQAVLDPGDRKQMTLTPRLPEHLATTRRWPRWMPWAVAGAGAVAMAGGVVLDQRSSAGFDAFDRRFAELCPGDLGCRDEQVPGEVRGRLDRAALQQWLARGIYLAGGLTMATGAALLYLNRERLVRRTGAGESPGVSFTPMLAPHAAGVSAHLRF